MDCLIALVFGALITLVLGFVFWIVVGFSIGDKEK